MMMIFFCFNLLLFNKLDFYGLELCSCDSFFFKLVTHTNSKNREGELNKNITKLVPALFFLQYIFFFSFIFVLYA